MTGRDRVRGLLVLVLVGTVASACHRVGEEYRRFPSPDGRYAIVVRFDNLSRGPMAPGSAGDRAGYVQLVGPAGQVLEETRVEMVAQVDQVRWEPGQVDVKLVATWSLPER